MQFSLNRINLRVVDLHPYNGKRFQAFSLGVTYSSLRFVPKRERNFETCLDQRFFHEQPVHRQSTERNKPRSNSSQYFRKPIRCFEHVYSVRTASPFAADISSKLVKTNGNLAVRFGCSIIRSSPSSSVGHCNVTVTFRN